MIKTWASKETEKIWHGYFSRKFPQPIQPIVRRKLRMINSAQDTNDLLAPPDNRLEKLKGEFNDFWCIRVNDQWRIIFKWENNHAYEIELIDYH